MRAHKSTSRYPGYDHTSFNLDHTVGRVKLHASLHIQHQLKKGGGFWFGLRPEVKVTRTSEDAVSARLAIFAKSRRYYMCSGCRKKELGEPDLRLPVGWHLVSAYTDVCPDCYETKTIKDLWEGPWN